MDPRYLPGFMGGGGVNLLRDLEKIRERPSTGQGPREADLSKMDLRDPRLYQVWPLLFTFLKSVVTKESISGSHGGVHERGGN